MKGKGRITLNNQTKEEHTAFKQWYVLFLYAELIVFLYIKVYFELYDKI